MNESGLIFQTPQNSSLTEFQTRLNEVSPSFCAAKWKQVTLHLQNGFTHSCHHPTAHKIPLEELKRNPSALHNTEFKKQQRKLMLQGKRPTECDYCWRVEDTKSESLSDRIYKSQESWAEPFIEDIANKPWDDDVYPSYVEVSFGNLCNLKCSYCFPQFSSRIMEEIETHGGYPTHDNFNNLDNLRKKNEIPISPKEHNPYVEAFWKWWPKLYPHLKTFRITGGEPLLNKNTFKTLDYIIENPNPDLSLAINSNLCIPEIQFRDVLEKIKRLLGDGLIKQFELFTSAEAKGKQAEYIRFGMDYNLWLDRINTLCKEVPELQLTVTSTYNVLSLPSYRDFLNDILTIKREYTLNSSQRTALYLETPYLRYPNHQAVFIIQPEMLKTLFSQVTFMNDNLDGTERDGVSLRGFYSSEIDKLKRIYNITASELNNPSTDNNTNRKDFVLFIDEHDRRRGTNFLETFPELEDFYHLCKSLL